MMRLEIPVLDEGNMKRYHDSFLKYYPMLLSFKEKFGHFTIPGEDRLLVAAGARVRGSTPSL
jgi:hypothetical protein